MTAEPLLSRAITIGFSPRSAAPIRSSLQSPIGCVSSRRSSSRPSCKRDRARGMVRPLAGDAFPAIVIHTPGEGNGRCPLLMQILMSRLLFAAIVGTDTAAALRPVPASHVGRAAGAAIGTASARAEAAATLRVAAAALTQRHARIRDDILRGGRCRDLRSKDGRKRTASDRLEGRPAR